MRESPFQAASVFKTGVLGGAGVLWWIVDGLTEESRVCSFNHSMAAVIAFVITSSSGISLFSKMSLFLATHRDHNIQGASGPVEMPTGGRQYCLHRAVHEDPKSIIPLASKVEEKGARLHTFCAKLQWRKRWVIDSASLHLLQLTADEMFLAARHVPTGRAPRKSFQRKSFSLGDTWSFQMFPCQSKGYCGNGEAILVLFFAVQYPELVE